MTGTGPLTVAIVGAGPAGLYAADEILRRQPAALVDVFERLPTPGGLVRSGVSPDHAQRRRVTEVYESRCLGSGRYRFHGNVEIGRDLEHGELAAAYGAVIYACGSAADRRLGIPGEDLDGSHAATDFVAWYNGHPDHAEDSYDLSCERAVVIGNGNVAMDVARMLLLGRERLAVTDVADQALAALSASNIREVVILGRRGPAQASFTLPELIEIGQLEDIDILIEYEGEIHPGGTTAEAMRLDVFRDYATRAPQGRAKRLVFRFCHSPLAILGNSKVSALRLVKNRLVVDSAGTARAEATDRVSELATGLVIRAVGYRGLPAAGLPFDAGRGVVPNLRGRVLQQGSNAPMAATYVAGWLKRGPTGVIGTNKQCSRETVTSLLQDWQSGLLPVAQSRPGEIDILLRHRNIRQVDVLGWRNIDRRERIAGSDQGRPRRKFTSHASLMAAAEDDEKQAVPASGS